jgi:hypothetical protein
MIIWILILLFFLCIFWILLGPVIIFVHTDSNRYVLHLPGIFRLALVPSEALFHVRVWIFFIPYTYHPFRGKKIKRKKAKDRGKPVEKKARKRRPGILSRNIGMVPDIFRSFRIRRLQMDIDTDDFLLNAWLIPAFSAVNSGQIRLTANFTGNLSLLLDVRTRLGKLLWIFIRNKIKSFY